MSVPTKLPGAVLAIRLRVPKVPNYLHPENGHLGPAGVGVVSVGNVPDDVLRAIGAEWTENLVKRAAEIRAARTQAGKGEG